MYRDMPMTPLSFCSVHSSVTCRRTSFFLLAATTTSAPRACVDARVGRDGANADVDATEVRASIARARVRVRRPRDGRDVTPSFVCVTPPLSTSTRPMCV